MPARARHFDSLCVCGEPHRARYGIRLHTGESISLCDFWFGWKITTAKLTPAANGGASGSSDYTRPSEKSSKGSPQRSRERMLLLNAGQELYCSLRMTPLWFAIIIRVEYICGGGGGGGGWLLLWHAVISSNCPVASMASDPCMAYMHSYVRAACESVTHPWPLAAWKGLHSISRINHHSLSLALCSGAYVQLCPCAFMNVEVYIKIYIYHYLGADTPPSAFPSPTKAVCFCVNWFS